MSFEHLQENAQRAFEDSRRIAESKPDVAQKMLADGHQLMTAYYLANADEAYVTEVARLIGVELNRFTKHPDQAYTYLQNQYALLCLSAGNQMGAKVMLSLPVNYSNSGAFDVQLNIKLRRILGISDVPDHKARKLSKFEADLLAAFDAALTRSEINWPAVASAWKSLRSKRFKLTVLEHRDLFTDALRSVQE